MALAMTPCGSSVGVLRALRIFSCMALASARLAAIASGITSVYRQPSSFFGGSASLLAISASTSAAEAHSHGSRGREAVLIVIVGFDESVDDAAFVAVAPRVEGGLVASDPQPQAVTVATRDATITPRRTRERQRLCRLSRFIPWIVG